MTEQTFRRSLGLIGGICLGIALAIILFWVDPGYPTDRCEEHRNTERIYHITYFGLNYPWWYGLGQARQESACRSNVTAFDKGMGLTQFMPATWRGVEKDMGVKLNPYNPEHSIRAQAFFMRHLHRQNPTGDLWLTYQSYNGGWTLLKKELQRAGIADHDLMRLECHRKVLTLKSGRLLDLCAVNYDYSQQVYRYAGRYRQSQDQLPWRFW